MKKTIKAALATSALFTAFAAAPAFAEDAPSEFTITGSATIASEYRLRGISQTDSEMAVQGGITVAHASGIYVGTWASNLGGNGTWGGSNMELDLIAGYTASMGGATLDGGFVYYIYPGTTGHDFYELYASVSGNFGPVKAKLGTYWTPPQDNVRIGASKGNNIWVYTDLAFPIEGTPITLKGHAGYSSGDSIYTWGKDVFDYSAGVDLTWKNLTLNVSYIGTDLPTAFANANFGAGSKSGHDITKGDVVASLTASF